MKSMLKLCGKIFSWWQRKRICIDFHVSIKRIGETKRALKSNTPMKYTIQSSTTDNNRVEVDKILDSESDAGKPIK